MDRQEVIQNFKEYTARRWPNASQLVDVIEFRDTIEISMVGAWAHVEHFSGLISEYFWRTGNPLTMQMDYFDAIHLRYYERPPQANKSLVDELERSGCQYIDMILYLSSWFMITHDIRFNRLFFLNHYGETVAGLSTIIEHMERTKILYDYFYQYEQRHKSSARDVFRCLPLPIANEILEYY